jgi:hypothetical protein
MRGNNGQTTDTQYKFHLEAVSEHEIALQDRSNYDGRREQIFNYDA